jgi:hypothetical protein
VRGAQSTKGDWSRPKLLPLSLALSAILWLRPYWSWTSPSYFRLSVVLVALAFLTTYGASRLVLTYRNVLCCLLLLALFLYYGSHSAHGVFDMSSGWLVLVLFIVADDTTKHEAFVTFAAAFAIMLIPGIVVFVLNALGIMTPWHYLSSSRVDFDLINGAMPDFYRDYFGSVVRNSQLFRAGSRTIFRLHGMFEEPGVIGTFAALLLAADEMRFRKRPHNVILLVGGLLSFSLAFYSMISLYALLRRPMRTAGVSACIIAVALSFPSLYDFPTVRFLFLNRFTLTGGQVLADTRVSKVFAALYQDFWTADLQTRLFGSKTEIGLLIDTGTFSYQTIFFTYGIMGMAALVAFLAVGSLSVSRSRAAVILLLLFLASIYQRPNVLILPYFLVLLGGAVTMAQVRNPDSALTS